MKKSATILLVLLLSLSTSVFALSPIPGTNVHDYAHILGNTRELDQRIETLYEKTGVEMAVVTVPKLEDESIELFSVKLFEQWGIGKKGVDKGLLLVISLEPRLMRLEVGYGLEGALPDSFVGLKLQELVAPSLAKNSVSGLIEYVSVLEGRIISQGDASLSAKDQVQTHTERKQNSLGGLILFLLIVVFVYVDYRFTGGFILGSLLGSSQRRYYRGSSRSGSNRSSSGGRSRYGGGGKSGGGGASSGW
ncbi:MAG TPA: TPM domain-containing protein [Firmicutes bacterium]|nr:TPM domain-containing protein [Bacillota bacterium]